MQISTRKLVLVSLREGIFKQDNRFHFVGKGKSWVLGYNITYNREYAVLVFISAS